MSENYEIQNVFSGNVSGIECYSLNCLLFSWAHNGMWAEVTWAASSPLRKPSVIFLFPCPLLIRKEDKPLRDVSPETQWKDPRSMNECTEQREPLHPPLHLHTGCGRKQEIHIFYGERLDLGELLVKTVSLSWQKQYNFKFRIQTRLTTFI